MLRSKKYLAILAVGILAAAGAVFFGVRSSAQKMKSFPEDGFILGENQTEGDSETVDQNYYFSAGDKYRVKYPGKVIFKDKKGTKVSADEDNFVHFNNNGLMGLKNGVFLDTDQLNEKTLRYYNIGEEVVLKKAGKGYSVQSGKEETQISNFIWKISDSKYLVVSDRVKLHLSKGNDETVQDYIEVEFVDKGVVRLAHQEGTYQTVGTDAYVQLDNGVRLNLQSKSIQKKNKEVMTLASMVIDSDDNIEVLEREESTQAASSESQKETVSSDQNTSGASRSSDGASGGDGGSGGSGASKENQNSGEKSDSDSKKDESSSEDTSNSWKEEDTKEEIPKFEIKEFKTGLIDVSAEVEITDDAGMLTGNRTIQIIEKGRERVVYSSEQTNDGAMNFKIACSALRPDTEYTMTIDGEYEYKEETYQKNFVTKVFRTDDMGLKFSKKQVTSDTMTIAVKTQAYSALSQAELRISKEDTSGEWRPVDTQGISLADSVQDKDYQVTFTGLSSDTEYKVELVNVTFENTTVNLSGNEETSKQIKTLKTSPVIGTSKVKVNEREASFEFYLGAASGDTSSGVIDKDHGIKGYRYEIYDSAQYSNGEFAGKPVKTVESEAADSVSVKVDGSQLAKNKTYVYQMTAEFYDNEKTVEYAGNVVGPFSLEGVDYPMVRWESEDIYHESMTGTITMSNTESIDQERDLMVIVRSGSDRTRTLKWEYNSDEGFVYPVNLKGLHANTYYTFEVFAYLKNEKGESEQRYIGGFSQKTEAVDTLTLKLNIPKISEADKDEPFDFSFTMEDTVTDDGSTQKNERLVKTIGNLEMELYREDQTQASRLGAYNIWDEGNTGILEDFSNYKYEANTVSKHYQAGNAAQKIVFSDFKTEEKGADYYTLKIKKPTDYTADESDGLNKKANEIPLKCEVSYGESSVDTSKYVKEENGYWLVRLDTHGFMPEYDTRYQTETELIRKGELDGYDEDVRDELLDGANGSDEVKISTAVGLRAQAYFDVSALKYAEAVQYTVYRKEGSAYVPVATAQEMHTKGSTRLPDHVFKLEPGVKNTADEKEGTLYRGHTYYVAASIRLNLNNNEQGSKLIQYYPEDTEKLTGIFDTSDKSKWPKVNTNLDEAQKKTYEEYQADFYSGKDSGRALKQTPQVRLYPYEMNQNNITYRYKYKDVDQAVITKNVSLNGKEQENVFSLNTESSSDDVEKTMKLSLPDGQFILEKAVRLNFEEGDTMLSLAEGRNDQTGEQQMKALKFQVDANDTSGNGMIGKLTVDLSSNDFALLNKIAAVDVVAQSTGSSDQVAISKAPLSNGKIVIPLTELEKFKGNQEFQIKLKVYYDTGKMGTSYISGSSFVMGYYESASSYGYIVDQKKTAYASGTYMENGSLPGDLYKGGEISGVRLVNQDLSADWNHTGTKKTYGFFLDQGGLKVDNEDAMYYVPKQIAQTEVSAAERCKFDYVRPEVDGVKTEPGLVDAKIAFRYYGTSRSELATENDGKSYIYVRYRKEGETNWKEEKVEITEKEIASSQNGIKKEVQISGLEKGTSYLYQICVNFSGDGDRRTPVIDKQQPTNPEPEFSFRTVNRIQFSGGIQYRFVNSSYKDKWLQFRYSPKTQPEDSQEDPVTIVTGYYVKYQLKDVTKDQILDLKDQERQETFLEETIADIKIDEDLRKQLVFGNRYRLTATAYAKTDAQGTDPIGESQTEFDLKELEKPVVIMSGVPTSGSDMVFSWTVSDRDYAVVDGEYQVKIYEGTYQKDYSGTALYEASGEIQEKGSSIGNYQAAGLKANTSYTAVITLSADKKYDYGLPNHKEEEMIVYKTFRTPDDNGISLGDYNVRVSKESGGKHVVTIDFFDSLGLAGNTKIKTVDYTIVAQSDGKTIAGTDCTWKTTYDSENQQVSYTLEDSDGLIADLPKGRYVLNMTFLDEKKEELKRMEGVTFVVGDDSVFFRIKEFFRR